MQPTLLYREEPRRVWKKSRGAVHYKGVNPREHPTKQPQRVALSRVTDCNGSGRVDDHRSQLQFNRVDEDKQLLRGGYSASVEEVWWWWWWLVGGSVRGGGRKNKFRLTKEKKKKKKEKGDKKEEEKLTAQNRKQGRFDRPKRSATGHHRRQSPSSRRRRSHTHDD